MLLLFLLYLVYAGTSIYLTYRRQPPVSEAWKAGFRPENCCSDTVSCDRARIVEDNADALQLRLRMVEHAKERVILSTFEIRTDESGKDMLAVLLAAAERGVRVQVITDGWPALINMRGDPCFDAFAAAENVELRVYNPLNPLIPWKVMGRLHDKYLIVDDDVYLLGGRNTYDFFLGGRGYQNYDRDVLVWTADPDSGESSIHQVEDYFRKIWNRKDCRTFRGRSDGETEAALEELRERVQRIREEHPTGEKPDYAAITYETNRITLLSNPTHVYAKEPTLFYSLTELMKHAGGSITIHTPYIICNDWMYDSFREICRRNPDTSLMTNSPPNNGNPFGASDYMKHKDQLLATGLKIYEYEGGVSYHGKSIAMGDRLTAVGSFNMDMRSVYLDTELMLVIDSRDVNAQMREIMAGYQASAVRVLDLDRYEVPENVKRQEFTEERLKKVRDVMHFNWLRFLM